MAGRRQEELRRRSNIVLVQANDRAADALELAEREYQARVELEVQLGRRLITRPQYLELQRLRDVVSDVALIVSDDYEAKRYSQQLQRTLRQAGINCQISGVRLIGNHETGGIVYTTSGNPETDIVFKVFQRAGFNFRGQPRENQYADFIPPQLPVIAVLDNPAVTKDWPPESWNEH